MPRPVSFVNTFEPRLEKGFLLPMDGDLTQLGEELDGLLVSLGIVLLEQLLYFLPCRVLALRECFQLGKSLSLRFPRAFSFFLFAHLLGIREQLLDRSLSGGYGLRQTGELLRCALSAIASYGSPPRRRSK